MRHRSWALSSLVLVTSCALAHERPTFDAGPIDAAGQRDAHVPSLDGLVPMTDAFVRPDARIDAFVPDDGSAMTDGLVPDDTSSPDAALPDDARTEPPDAWVMTPVTQCSTVARQTIHVPADRGLFERLTSFDLDGDGRGELVALGRNAVLPAVPSVHVFHASGSGLVESWRTPARPEYSYPYGLAHVDMDGDGDEDLIASMGGMRVFFNTAGALTEGPRMLTYPLEPSFDLDDLDGDGDIDIVGSAAGGTTNPTLAIINQPDGFHSEVVGGQAASMLSRGGVHPLLVVTGERMWGTVGVWERRTLDWHSVFTDTNGAAITGVASGDFDGDGLEDFVMLPGAGQGLWFYRQSPAGTFVRTREGSGLVGVVGQTLAIDVDGDHDLDLIVASFVDGSVWLYESTGGTFREHRSTCTFLASSQTIYAMAAGDFDGDHALDLAVAVGPEIVVVSDLRNNVFGM